MAEQVVVKTPLTTIPQFDVDFTDDLTGDTALDSALSDVIVTDTAGNLKSTAMVANKTVSSMTLLADLKGGDDGEDYHVVFRGYGNTTKKPFDRVIELRVRSKHIGAM